MAKAMRDLNGIDLRMAAKGRGEDRQRQAVTELERRRGNLRGAVLPAWELELRGPDYLRWELV